MKLIGLCGLPNSGKSTLLKLLSKIELEIAPYPFTTKKPKEVIVPVLTDELISLHNITKTKDLFPASLNFLDVPGLIKGSHKGLGLGNEFLSYLRSCDIVLEVVRNFEREDVPHSEGEIDPERDILIIEEEIIEADKRIIEENLKKLKKAKIDDKVLALENILKNLEPFKRFKEYDELLKEYNLLITKDWYLILNGERKIDLGKFENLCFKKIYKFDFEFELELEENEDLKKEYKSEVKEFLKNFRKDLNIIQFFTFTKEITQSWFLENGSNILKAAGIIHSDFEKKFKYAEVIELEKFLELYKNSNETIEKIVNLTLAKNSGFLKTVGKDYIVKDCDIIKIFI
jgi:ribosome-binding ATPase YchF (GTP1/OBG family)